MAVGMGSLSLGWSLLWEGGAQPFLSPSRAPLCLGGGAVLCHPPPPLFILQPPGGCWMHTGLWGGEGDALSAHLREEGVIKGPKP